MPSETPRIPRIPPGRQPRLLPALSSAAAAAARVSWHAYYKVRLASGDDLGDAFDIALPINPERVTVGGGVEYAEHRPLGYSQTVLQYVGSGALELSFQIVYDVVVVRGQGAYSPGDEERVRLLLYSLTKPVFAGRGPRRVRLIWPSWLATAGVLTEVGFTITHWFRNGAVRAWTADVRYVEQNRLFMPASVARQAGMHSRQRGEE